MGCRLLSLCVYLGAFHTRYIALCGALRHENNYVRHIQTEVLKTATSKGPSEWRISKGTTDAHFGPPWSFAQILSMMTAPLCGHGMMTQEGTSRNSCVVPYTLQPFKALTEGKPFEGIRAYEPFRMERRVWCVYLTKMLVNWAALEMTLCPLIFTDTYLYCDLIKCTTSLLIYSTKIINHWDAGTLQLVFLIPILILAMPFHWNTFQISADTNVLPELILW